MITPIRGRKPNRLLAPFATICIRNDNPDKGTETFLMGELTSSNTD